MSISQAWLHSTEEGAHYRYMDPSTQWLNKSEAPVAGVGGRASGDTKTLPGAPIQNFSQKPFDQIHLTMEKKSGENFDQLSTLTTEEKSDEIFSTVTLLRNGEYYPGICNTMIAYFDQPKVRKIIDHYTWKSGAVEEKVREIPNTPPHFSEFARKIGVTTTKLKRWCKEHPEFKEAYITCQEILEEFLIDNGLTGGYQAVAMKFVAVNRSRMKDKTTEEKISFDFNKAMDQIAAGKIRPGGLLDMPDETDE